MSLRMITNHGYLPTAYFDSAQRTKKDAAVTVNDKPPTLGGFFVPTTNLARLMHLINPRRIFTGGETNENI